MLVVHHLGISQSDRIVWLCEELGIDYQLERYERDPVTRLAPAEYRALTAFGTAPVITDGDLVLGESAAIIDYIIEVHGGGRLKVAPDAPNYPAYLFWFHFANGSLMPAAMVDMLVGASTDGLAAALKSRLDRAYAALEERLGTVPWLAGDAFTAADIISLFPVTTMRMFAARDISPYPNLRAWIGRVAERPAFRRAMEKADPGLEIPLA